MKLRFVLTTITCILAAPGMARTVFAQQSALLAPADILIMHAKVYTLDPEKPWAQAVAIRKGKIQAVGRDEEVERYRGIDTKWINAGGKLVLPGFTDCHVHFYYGSASLRHANLEGAKDVTELRKRLTEYAAQHPDDAWILGHGWDYSMFGEAGLPDKKYLDDLFPNRPVFLEGYDFHTFWVNSKALALAGITKDTPNPRNGVIVRDPKTGEATGTLKEDADALIRRVIPEASHAEKLQTLRAGLQWTNRNGLTRVHSARWDSDVLPLLDELRQEKQLSVRFHLAYWLKDLQLSTADLENIEAARRKYRDEWIDANSAKVVLDGVIESHTAALLEPYADDPSTKGELAWKLEKYRVAILELDKRGVQIYTHAIGDAAVRTALDTYEFAAKKNHTHDRRHRIEHVETVGAADIPRFAKLGVIASMQPLHSYPDEDTLNVWVRDVGPDCASRAWAWNSIRQAGGHYAFGSDWPIVTLNPWQGIQTAVTRQTAEGTPKEGFVPAQRLSVAQAVEGYTLGAAYAGRMEKTEGSIVVDKVADVIIVDRNIFEIDPHTIGDTKVVTTIVGGKVVYEAEAK